MKDEIVVRIVEVEAFTKLNAHGARPTSLTYLVFGDQFQTWVAHLISAQPDFDQIALVLASRPISDSLRIEFSQRQDPLSQGLVYKSAAGVEVKVDKTVYTETGDLSL